MGGSLSPPVAHTLPTPARLLPLASLQQVHRALLRPLSTIPAPSLEGWGFFEAGVLAGLLETHMG